MVGNGQMEEKFCSGCGAPLRPGARFCNRCGRLIQPGTPKSLREAVSRGKMPTKTVVLGTLFIGVLVAVTFFAFRSVFFSTPRIEDYYPRSGPAGSWVALKLKYKDPLELEKLQATYNGKPVPIVAAGDRMIQIALPQEARSGKIRLKKGRAASNAVFFTVLERETIPLLSQQVGPASTPQVVSYRDEIRVVIPPNLLDKARTLTISRVKNPPYSDLAGPAGLSFAFDVSIEGMETLKDFIEIGVKYDPSLIDPALPAKDQLAAARWHDKGGYWVTLPTRVDEKEHMLYMLTDHLTLFEWLILGGAAAGAVVVTWAGEYLLNDVYVTPQGNFKILYDKKSINKDPTLNDQAYEMLYPKRGLLAKYKTEHPRFIQDVGEVLERALQKFCGAGFKDPVRKTGWLRGNYTSPVIVKIDSYWSSLLGEPNYEKIFERIHLPAISLTGLGNPAGLGRIVAAHELFHRLQAEYYGIVSMSYPSNRWWIESTAEFAGQVFAWDTPMPGRYGGIQSDFLSHSISTTGRPPGWADRDYEYASFVWTEFLVEECGINFRELVEYVAGGSPLVRLDEFMRRESRGAAGLFEAYREFAGWSVFSSGTFLKKYPIAFENDTPKAIAEKKDVVQLLDTDSMSINVGGGTSMGSASVLVFVRSEGNERDGSVFPDLQLAPGGKGSLKVKGGTIVYLLAVNANAADVALPVKVKLGEEEKEHVFSLRGNCSAKLWAVKINKTEMTINPAAITGGQPDKEYTFRVEAFNIPREAGEVTFEWDFGDGKTDSKGSHKAKTRDQRASTELKHTYVKPGAGEKSEYTLQVSLKDKNRVLARASARVVLEGTQVASNVPSAATAVPSFQVYPCTVYTEDGRVIEHFEFVLLPKEEFFNVASHYAGRPPTEKEKQEAEADYYNWVYRRLEDIMKAVPQEFLPQVLDGRLWVLIHGNCYSYNVSGELLSIATFDRGVRISVKKVKEEVPRGHNPLAVVPQGTNQLANLYN